MDNIKAIQTRYKGYNFRSKLEAHWAVFFDIIGLKWKYESQGYDLGDLGWYLPDFILTGIGEQKYVYEVKPRGSKDGEEKLYKLINSNIGFSGGYILRGDPVDVFIEDNPDKLIVCPRCGIIQLDNINKNYIYCWVCDMETPDGGDHPEEQSLIFKDIKYYPHKGDIVLSESNIIKFNRFIRASANKARGARFDHGACGEVIENKDFVENDDFRLLQNIIKTYILNCPEEVLELLSILPETKSSKIFLPQCAHKFIDSTNNFCFDESYCEEMSRLRKNSSDIDIQNIFKNPIDVVYRFGVESQMRESYYIVHLIRTDQYDILKEMNKYYIHTSHIRYLIWSYPQHHENNVIPVGKYIKQMDINYLKNSIMNKIV